MLRVFQPESRFNNLDDWHFADIAHSLGGTGERATTRRELAAALDRAVAQHGNFSDRSYAAARGDVRHVGELRIRLQGGARTHGEVMSY
jgi:indolepyruvate decarboxylase